MIDDDKNETITSLLHTIALIREAAGVGEKPMLSELPDVIRKLCEERDEARRLYCEEWAFTIELERGEASDPRDLANEKKWDCFKENTDYLQDLG